MAFSHCFVETCLSISVSLAISTSGRPEKKTGRPKLSLEAVARYLKDSCRDVRLLFLAFWWFAANEDRFKTRAKH